MDKKPNPSTDGDNGSKDKVTGRFVKGNKLGKGNPMAKKVANHRVAMLAAVTEKDTREVIVKLIEAAKAGEAWAINTYLDRIVGKPVTSVDVTTSNLTPEQVLEHMDAILGLKETK